ncbi:MAG: hypothetical protein ACR2KW_04195 [Rubrobacter sp.]
MENQGNQEKHPVGRMVEGDDGTLFEEVAPEKVGFAGAVRNWFAWGRRSPQNKVLFVLSIGVAVFVTATFGWGTFNAEPEGDATLYIVFYWVWGLCAINLLFGMAEWKTSPLRKNAERGHLFILLYIGALLIITRALNSVLFGGYL